MIFFIVDSFFVFERIIFNIFSIMCTHEILVFFFNHNLINWIQSISNMYKIVFLSRNIVFTSFFHDISILYIFFFFIFFYFCWENQCFGLFISLYFILLNTWFIGYIGLYELYGCLRSFPRALLIFSFPYELQTLC